MKLFSRECKKVADEISVKNKIDFADEKEGVGAKKKVLVKNKML